MTHRLGIIGGGNMGQAIVRGSIAAGLMKSGDVLVAEIDPMRRQELACLGCTTTEDPALAVGCEEIMLAVKPQVFSNIAKVIGPLREPKVVISIMAGLSSRVIRVALGEHAHIVRVMPNTPCRVGVGMAAIALGEGARPGDESLAVAVFDSLGETTMVDESLMHAVTAVSGSGPAYIFLLAEAMQQAAEELGLDRSTSQLLVKQTICGAGKLLVEADEDAAELRRVVTSPGGTTQAAMEEMLKRDLPAIVRDAIKAARDRSVELDQ
ncbi:MAG: pyrroline-5-carboxylate reductase [Phycisphaerales bacterium]